MESHLFHHSCMKHSLPRKVKGYKMWKTSCFKSKETEAKKIIVKLKKWNFNQELPICLVGFINHKKWIFISCWNISFYTIYIDELVSLHLYTVPDLQWWSTELRAFSSQHYNCHTAQAMLLKCCKTSHCNSKGAHTLFHICKL